MASDEQPQPAGADTAGQVTGKGDASSPRVLRRRRVRMGGGSRVDIVWVGVLILVLVALGGGTQLWAQGLFLMVCGLWALLYPPEKSPTRKLDWVLLLLGLWCLLSFLPQGLMGRAGWRSRAASSGLDLGWMATPQPWVTAEAFVLLLGGVVWFYLVWNSRVDYISRKKSLWLLAVGTALLAVGSYVLSMHYGWRQDQQMSLLAYSFFPNKNQTGLFMAMGGVVAFGLMMHQWNCRRFKTGTVALLLMVLCFAGAYESQSRAALLLFFLGSLLWIAVAIPPRGIMRMMRVVLPVIVVVVLCLLMLGKNSLERFRVWFDQGMASELRIDIYQDTFTMVTKLPPYGVTAGNFETVFPLYRNYADVAGTILHPESDWLWVMAELGVPGFSLIALAVLVAVARLVPFGEDEGVPYRAAALAALGIFLLHSLIDVPGHRLGTLLAAILCYRLAVMPLKMEREVLLPSWVFRVSGVGLLLIGAVWAGASWLDKPWHSSIASGHALAGLSEAVPGREVMLSADILEKAPRARPMDWRLYTQRARYQLQYNRDAEAAQKDFAIAAFLEPNISEVSYLEGLAWLNFSPRLAATAWREALRRKSHIPHDLHNSILGHGGRAPQFARELAALSLQDPNLRVRYLLQRRGRSFDDAILYERSEDPTFSSFSAQQRASILRHWAMHSEGESLRSHLRRFPSITPDAWYYEGLSWAAAGQHERAVQVAHSSLPIPRFPEFVHFSMADNEELRRRLLLNPEDLVRGSVLLTRQINEHDWVGARETVGLLLRGTERPGYLLYWDGELKRLNGDYAAAWAAWLPYMETVTKPND